jgi:hypothetical protein
LGRIRKNIKMGNDINASAIPEGSFSLAKPTGSTVWSSALAGGNRPFQ